jgi:hypothetical protein
MSDGRLSVCPKCLAGARAKRDNAFADLGGLYGKVPAAQYTEALDNARELPERRMICATLREEFYSAMDDYGNFRITYSADCPVCEFVFHFKHDERVCKP